MSDKPKPVEAWGVINYAGTLMEHAFMSELEARIDMMTRWPNREGGKCRVIPVTITPKENSDEQ